MHPSGLQPADIGSADTGARLREARQAEAATGFARSKFSSFHLICNGKLDFYGAALSAEAEERLRACETLLDAYARQVFDAHDENR
jgi:hypothetical protein